ncbi:MAG: zinc-binding dehydrogenase, partial [Sulfolobaceae archaeon]
MAAPRIPKDLPDTEVAPMMCGGITAYGAVRKLITEVRLPAGKTVAIIGAAGGLGHYAVQIAKAFGYRVVGIDIGQERLRFVEKLGADYVVDAGEAEKFVKERLGGVYASLVFTPRIKGYELGLRLLRPPGALIVVGIPAENEGPIPITPLASILGFIKVIPSIVGVTNEFEDLFSLAVDGRVKSHVSRVIGFSESEINTLFEELEKA